MDVVGSSGTFAATVLESAGYYYQQLVLDSFTPSFAGSLGTLVFLVGIIMALLMITTTGGYRETLWFLLGPALFFSVIIPRTETVGSTWKVGSELQDHTLVGDGIIDKVADQGFYNSQSGLKPARVSAFFAWFNELSSFTVNKISEGLLAGKELTNLGFIVRQELNAHVRSLQSSSPQLNQLIHSAFFGYCRDTLELGRQFIDEKNSTREDILKEDYEEKQNERVIRVNNWPYAAEFIADLQVAYGGKGKQYYEETMRDSKTYEYFRDCVKKKDGQTVVSSGPGCDLEQAKMDDAFSAATRESFIQGIIMEEGKQYEITFPDGRTSQVERIVGVRDTPEYEAEFPGILATVNQKPYSCRQVWSFVRFGLIVEAKQAIEQARTSEYSDANGLNNKKLLEGLVSSTGINVYTELRAGRDILTDPSALVSLYQSIALYMLRNEVNNQQNTAFLARYIGNTEVEEITLPNEEELIQKERRTSKRIEFEERSKLMVSAAQIPYYQGLILYFLAMTFPFFAILLLLPGQYSGFIFWCGLWFWAKSWDIGFTVMYLLDDMLWAIFEVAHQVGERAPIPEKIGDKGELSEALYALRELDPTMELGTYYAILAVAIHSIPIIASFLVIGSMRSGVGLISKGVTTFSNNYAALAQATVGTNAAHALRTMANRFEMVQAGINVGSTLGKNSSNYGNIQSRVSEVGGKGGKPSPLVSPSGPLNPFGTGEVVNPEEYSSVLRSQKARFQPNSAWQKELGTYGNVDDYYMSSLGARETAIMRGVAAGVAGRYNFDGNRDKLDNPLKWFAYSIFGITGLVQAGAKGVDPTLKARYDGIMDNVQAILTARTTEATYAVGHDPEYLDYLFRFVEEYGIEIPWFAANEFADAQLTKDITEGQAAFNQVVGIARAIPEALILRPKEGIGDEFDRMTHPRGYIILKSLAMFGLAGIFQYRDKIEDFHDSVLRENPDMALALDSQKEIFDYVDRLTQGRNLPNLSEMITQVKAQTGEKEFVQMAKDLDTRFSNKFLAQGDVSKPVDSYQRAVNGWVSQFVELAQQRGVEWQLKENADSFISSNPKSSFTR